MKKLFIAATVGLIVLCLLGVTRRLSGLWHSGKVSDGPRSQVGRSNRFPVPGAINVRPVDPNSGVGGINITGSRGVKFQ